MTLRNKLAIVGLSGIMFAGAAVGLAGTASAQDDGLQADLRGAVAGQAEATDNNRVAELDDIDPEGEFEAIELSPEDEAVFERFDQCLTDNGLPAEIIGDEADAIVVDGEELTDEEFEAYAEELTDEELEALFEQWDGFDEDLEAAFETCEPILEDLSEEAYLDDLGELTEFDDFELSEEDEAVLERFDQCLVDNGIDELESSIDEAEELTDEQWEAIEADAEKVFETCESILDDLSEDAEYLFEDCPDDEDHDYDEAEEVEPTSVNA